MAYAPMFARAMGLPSRMAMYGLFCLALMVVDSRFDAMTAFRSLATGVINPIQAVLAKPFIYLGDMTEFFAVHGELVRENKILTNERQRLTTQLQNYRLLQDENTQLRKLLDLPIPAGAQPLAAEITHIRPDPFDRRLTIDKGAMAGVEAGRPVVDATGLVGQVTLVSPTSSEVSLLTSREQSAPAMVLRNGLRLIVTGMGSDDLMEIRYLDQHADVKPGDILVTSGIDGVYPPGIPVARVLRIDPPHQTPFARAVCQPIGEIGHHRHVLVLLEHAKPVHGTAPGHTQNHRTAK